MKIYGLIGYPVKHSYSAVMHNAAFKKLGINAEYRLFEVSPQELADFLLKDIEVKDIEGKPIRTSQLAGFNITIPHKVKAYEILEKKFPLASVKAGDEKALIVAHYVRSSGATNTVKRAQGGLAYYNTDASGFLRSLEETLIFDVKEKNILVAGCGGAGRAVIAALSWKNSGVNKIYVSDINKGAIDSARKHFSQFDYISSKLQFILTEEISDNLRDCQLLVNASSLGMKEGDPSPIKDKNLLHSNLSVYDVVYNRQTQLIKDAQEQGLKAAGGIEMLLYQGVGAFEYWREIKAPVEVMRKALLEKLNAG